MQTHYGYAYPLDIGGEMDLDAEWMELDDAADGEDGFYTVNALYLFSI